MKQELINYTYQIPMMGCKNYVMYEDYPNQIRSNRYEQSTGRYTYLPVKFRKNIFKNVKLITTLSH